MAAWVISHHSELGSCVTASELKRLWQLNRPLQSPDLLIGTFWLAGPAESEAGCQLRRFRRDRLVDLDRRDGVFDSRIAAARDFLEAVDIIEDEGAPVVAIRRLGVLQNRGDTSHRAVQPPRIASLADATRVELLRHLQRVLIDQNRVKHVEDCLEHFAVPSGIGTLPRFKERIVEAIRELERSGMLRVGRGRAAQGDCMKWRLSLTPAGAAQ